MGCCGQKRALLKSSPAPTATPAQPSVARQPAGTSTARTASTTVAPVKARVPGSGTPENAVVLRYLERSPILVQGPATGRHYSFSASDPLQSVDRRDADLLMRTRFFRLS